MAVESWIDSVCRLWEISDGKGGTLRSYRVYERAEFPEALALPCVLTYTTETIIAYTMNCPELDLWNGISEFHLTADVGKHNYPGIMLFFARIKNAAAAAAAIDLGGGIAKFELRTDIPSIQGPVRLQYGQEAEHLGLIANWQALETTSP